MKKLLSIGLILSFVLLLAACDTENENDKLKVVTTTTYIFDMLNNIGGEHIEVYALMDVGVDPHDFQPRQSDTSSIQNADLVVVNGLNLEERMGEVLSRMDEDKLLVLGDHVASEKLLYETDNVIDPHIWFDISIWQSLSEIAGEKLQAMDPDNAEYYRNRTISYIQDLTVLKTYVESRVSELDESKRVLVTAHDAFAYFGEAYGFEVHAVQGISTASEASISDIETLAKLLVELDVNRVFWESSVPQSTVDALVEATLDLGHDVSVGGQLYSDSTGDKMNGHETYIRTFRANIDTIVDALGE